MAETLGSLCDKLTIVKLKEWHSQKQPGRMRSLAAQEQQLREEIDAFIADAASGRIPVDRLTFAANKVYRVGGNNHSWPVEKTLTRAHFGNEPQTHFEQCPLKYFQ